MKINNLFQGLCAQPLKTCPQAIFFDAMGTLFGLRGTVGEIYTQVAMTFGVEVNPDALTLAFFAAFKAAPPLAFGETDTEILEKLEFQWWRSLAMTCFEKVGVLESFDDFDTYFTALYNYFATAQPWFIYEDVIPTLNYWQEQGVILGVISNFDSRLLKVLAALELQDYFSSVLISSRHSVAKPDPQIFQLALATHGLTPEMAWHIGDSVREDYQGAMAAGLTAFLIER